MAATRTDGSRVVVSADDPAGTPSEVAQRTTQELAPGTGA